MWILILYLILAILNGALFAWAKPDYISWDHLSVISVAVFGIFWPGCWVYIIVKVMYEQRGKEK
jgi:hypothetical protein